MEPLWYIHKSTGLAVLENGGVVDWSLFKASATKTRLNSYMKYCNGSSKKRRSSMDAATYHDYRSNVMRTHAQNMGINCDCDDCV